MRKKIYSLSLLGLFYSSISLAIIDTTNTEQQILNLRNDWYNYLKSNIINEIPTADSDTAEWDRLIINSITKNVTTSRYNLAELDANEDEDYVYTTFAQFIFDEDSLNRIDLLNDDSFDELESLYKLATYAYDVNKSKNRSIDFILKDIFARGRPYQVLDSNGNYLNNYTNIVGTSFPSGHTWEGFKQAATLSILFPEKGSEIFSRAVEYGESRVILEKHFATDTIASRIGNYFILSELLSNDEITQTLVDLALETRATLTLECQNDITNCFQQADNSVVFNNATGYYYQLNDDDAYLITPEELPELSGYLLRLRFPYLDNNQRLSILSSTAYPTNSIAAWQLTEGDPDSYWGLINLPSAYDGPAYFYDTFTVNQDPYNNDYDIASFTSWDEWTNNINGPGRLVKTGSGTLKLSGDGYFGGVDVNQGELIISGNSTYSGISTVNGGTLQITGTLGSPVTINQGTLDLVDGTVNSTITVNEQGVLMGEGTIQDLQLNSGSTVIPGHSIGTLTVVNDLVISDGTNFLVEIAPDGTTDTIESQGTIIIEGGNLKLSLENSDNLLQQSDVQSLIGSQFTILTADQGINGQFNTIEPDYLFLGANLTYSDNSIQLNIGRTSLPYSSAASTYNEQQVAHAIESLGNGNPLFESILTIQSTEEAQTTFDGLSGQIHADLLSQQINASHYYRDSLVSRMRTQERMQNLPQHTWINLLGNWSNSLSDGNADPFNAFTYGVLMGVDKKLDEKHMQIGVATGYTRTTINESHQSSANTDDYHALIYAGKQISALSLRSGIGYTWHNNNTERTTNYQAEYNNRAKYNSSTSQVFLDVGYEINDTKVNLEPFINVTHVNASSNSFTEKAGAVSLTGKVPSINSTLSTVGLRLEHKFEFEKQHLVTIDGELGWIHQHNDLERSVQLGFNSGGDTFTTKSIPAAQDAMTMKINSNLSFNKNITFSFSYNGLTAKNHNDNTLSAQIKLTF
ncbi:autotransporter domain-containing protein [Providencia manganoxydans]|uniref:autotransporter domain-containing protein n=1 Tax=Providencia manganoxydans TaxID=2923283 RepID=UPI0032DBE1AB